MMGLGGVCSLLSAEFTCDDVVLYMRAVLAGTLDRVLLALG